MNNRQLYYDYDEVTLGPRAGNWPEVMKYIVQFCEGKDEWREQRQAVCNRFHRYQDGNSSERVFNMIRGL